MHVNEYIPVNGKFFNKGLQEDRFYPVATRRPRLTLKHLSKLRKTREMRRLEKSKHDRDIIDIYRTPEDSNDKPKKH